MLVTPMAGFIVRKKHWTKYLPDGFVVEVYMNTILGRIVSFSMVLIKDDECITRYDNAHGFPHRDVIGRKSASPIDKVIYDTLTLEQAFSHANKDLSENYAKYYEYYESH